MIEYRRMVAGAVADALPASPVTVRLDFRRPKPEVPQAPGREFVGSIGALAPNASRAVRWALFAGMAATGIAYLLTQIARTAIAG